MASKKRKRRPRNLAEWFNGVTEYFEYMFHQFFRGVGQVFSGIGALILPRRLIDKMRKRSSERAARSVTSESKMGKTVEKLEDRFHVALRSVGSTFSDIFKLFVPTKLIESTEKAVSAKTKSVFGRISKSVSQFLERITPKWLRTILEKLSDRLSFITKFTGAWAKSRNYRALAWSLPALLLSLPIVASLLGNVVYSSEDKKKHYEFQRLTAIDERNDSVEQLCSDKLAQLGWKHLNYSEFTAAVAKAEDGRWNEAVAAMEAIAPLEEPGLPPAHLWLASQLASTEGHYKPSDPWAAFETHARHAKANSTGRYRDVRPTAERFIVEADLHHGRIDEAMKTMVRLTDDGLFPDLHGHLMEQSAKRRDFSKAQRHARKAASRFESLPDLSDLNSHDFKHWVLAYRLLGKNKEMLEVIAKAREKFGSDAALQSNLQEQFAQRLADISFREKGSLELFEQALTIDPKNQLVIAKLTRGVLRGEQAATSCIDELEQRGKLPAEVLYQLGDDAIQNEDGPTASGYYKRACKIAPTEIRAWNNLAYILSELKPANYELALKAIEKALELEDDSRIFETKGQILCKMGKWEEAIPFLQRGLNGSLADPGPTHKSLAEAYEKTGNLESAAAHRGQAGTAH